MPSQAGIPTAYSLRQLLVESTVVARCVPTRLNEAGIPTGELTVVEVVAGEGVVAGETIDVAGFGKYVSFWPPRDAEEITDWLFFLHGRIVNGVAVNLGVMQSGIWCRTKDGKIHLSSDRVLRARSATEFPMTWQGILNQVKRDYVQVKQLRKIRQLKHVAQRNHSLLAWIEKNRSEFGGPASMWSGHPHGWAELEFKLFQEIGDSAELDTVWKAVAHRVARRSAGRAGPWTRLERCDRARCYS